MEMVCLLRFILEKWSTALAARWSPSHSSLAVPVKAFAPWGLYLCLAMMPTMPGSAARRCRSFRASLGAGLRPACCQGTYLPYVYGPVHAKPCQIVRGFCVLISLSWDAVTLSSTGQGGTQTKGLDNGLGALRAASRKISNLCSAPYALTAWERERGGLGPSSPCQHA